MDVKYAYILALFAQLALATDILLIMEPTESDLATIFVTSVNATSSNEVKITRYEMNHDNDEDTSSFCTALSAAAFSAIVDLSWGGWPAAKAIAVANGIPYIQVEASNKPFVRAVDQFLYERQAIDAALLFQSEAELDQSLYHIIGNYNLRVLVVSMDEDDPFGRMSKLRPVPSAFVAFGTTSELTNVINVAKNRKMIRRDSRWNFVVEDFDAPNFLTSGLDVDITVVSLSQQSCCGLTGQEATNPVTCLSQCSSGVKPKQIIVKKAGEVVATVVKPMTPADYSCTTPSANNDTRTTFLNNIKSTTESLAKNYDFDNEAGVFLFPLSLDFQLVNKSQDEKQLMATWSNDGTEVAFTTEFENKAIPRFFRVGMSVAIPWLYEKRDKDGNPELDKDGNIIYEGYCMDLLQMIASKLDFEYEVVITEETRPGYVYGKKLDDGSWTGMIRDLARGDTDIIVADLTMTSEREEIIDFVSPYFDQAGISIVLRKRLREQSLFKFLSVLKTEVWLGIVGAVIVTAILIWLLDRYSPYSARNNKAAYPYPCRDFTLKESFWFALTSLTPQGGGEAPKALSGRVLVAAYWLFVVLMLATFTANLAAFLTVERMQTTVQSLEELARQSRINYTVVANTSYMEYFVNMAGAEEELYHKWKELTLNSSGNPARYRVWDYPIREQYTQILKVIDETGPVTGTREGFDRVLDNLEGDFAFIHDAARIRYEVFNNCNLTEIGEPFAEQPYALAVQQGSHLQEELSRVILELQKDRYFETLQSTYWNSTKRNNCPVLDDSEGITLQSLGGVFIATLIGLGLALITLAVEVVLQKKRESNKVKNMALAGGAGKAGMGSVMSGDSAEYVHTIRGRKGAGMPAIIGNQ